MTTIPTTTSDTARFARLSGLCWVVFAGSVLLDTGISVLLGWASPLEVAIPSLFAVVFLGAGVRALRGNLKYLRSEGSAAILFGILGLFLNFMTLGDVGATVPVLLAIVRVGVLIAAGVFAHRATAPAPRASHTTASPQRA